MDIVGLLKVVAVALGYLCSVLQWAYNHYGKFHMLVRRVRFQICNTATFWNASFRFTLNHLPEERTVIKNLYDHIVKDADDHFCHNITGEWLHVSVNGQYYKIRWDEEVQELLITINDIVLPFRDSKRMLDGRLMHLIGVVDNLGHVTSSTYELTVKFGESHNPYLTDFARRYNRKRITTMDMIYSLENDYAEVVGQARIGLTGITITTCHRETFRFHAVQILGLSHLT